MHASIDKYEHTRNKRFSKIKIGYKTALNRTYINTCIHIAYNRYTYIHPHMHNKKEIQTGTFTLI